jgi:two-component system KDP operon response regulator KdpE
MSDNPIAVAVIEDEAPIRKFLRAALIGEGYRVLEAETAREGLRIITQEHPQAVILDLGLPDRDGLEIVGEVRAWSNVPIVILSARGQEQEKILALDAGADDYLTKPFSVGELLARLRAALRRAARVANASGPEQTTFTFGHVRVDLAARHVFADDREVKLTKLEFDLLQTLIQHAGKVLTHSFLLKAVWGPHAAQERHYVRVFMANLRKKLERNPARPEFLITEQGVGYRLAEPSATSTPVTPSPAT